MGSFLEKKKLTFEKSHDFWENGLRKLKTCLWKDDQTGLENSFEKISWVFSFFFLKEPKNHDFKRKGSFIWKHFYGKIGFEQKKD